MFIRKYLQKFDQPGWATSARLKCLELCDYNAIFGPIKQSYGLPKLPKFVREEFFHAELTKRVLFRVWRCVGLPLFTSTL